jgi:hypothetical protein
MGIPTNWVKVGVVAKNYGTKILAINNSNASKQWIDGYLWSVKGTAFSTDSTDHTLEFTFYVGATNVVLNFTYNASSLEEIATQFTAFCNTNISSLGANNMYQAYVGVDWEGSACIIFQKDKFTDYRQYQLGIKENNVAISVHNIINDQSLSIYNSSIKLVNELSSDYPVMNVGRYCNQYAGSTEASRNPTSLVNSIPATPVSLASYTGPYCQYLRDIYGDGTEGYYKYISGYLPKMPDFRGAFSSKYRSGLENTKNLAQYRITEYNSIASKALYTAADYCYNISYNNPKVSQGNWFLASIYELCEVIPELRYSATASDNGKWGLVNSRELSDPINKSLVAINGSALPLSSGWWSSVRRNSLISWVFYSNGALDTNTFDLSQLCVPCCFLDL